MRSRWIALCICFVLVSDPVLAHFCDASYPTEQDRADCRWRYWNGESTAADRQGPAVSPAATPVPAGSPPEAQEQAFIRD